MTGQHNPASAAWATESKRGALAVAETPFRTSLTRYAPAMRDPDPDGPKRMAARKWHEDGTIILLPESIARLDWQDRELVEAITAKIYGLRGSK